ncbi:MAG: oligosaccharide flippase family protein [Sedimenticola sp.]|nr:oligosaccharide flippase family protein [Sedimenticola sp.]
MSTRITFAIVLAEKYVSILIQLVGSMIVARLLTPSEFGVFSLAMSVSILAQVFRDLGIGQYLIQEKELTQDKIKAAQSILVISSAVLGLFLILGAQAAAEFYQEPKVKPLLLIFGINFFLLPIGAVTYALWRRNLEFGRLSIISTAATFGNTLTTIVLAYQGYSYLSLGWGVLIGSIITAVLCICLKPPNLSYSLGFKSILQVFRYSSLATFNSFLDTFKDRSPSLFLGKFVGMDSVGIFERAVGLAELFNRLLMQAVWSIAMPLIADRVRSGNDIEKGYLYAVALVTGAGMAFFGWLIIAADVVVYYLFGDQWNEAVPLVRLLCLQMAIEIPNYLSSSLIIGHGHIKRQTILTILSRGISITGVVVGVFWGVRGVAIGMVLSSFINSMIILYFLHYYISPFKILATTTRSLAPAIVLVSSMLFVKSQFDQNDLTSWIISSLVAFFIWLLIIVYYKHPLSLEGEKVLVRIKEKIN